ncbi:SseB family protein [Kineosporia sp. J2-2]|uniref:SseB family protein n=1 Tax=Kineosporia corallincola TaxID=2835133 RepID=A0ABS5TJ40_9ACTN|nr:SseB family protein [Kineosporia corallincola]MBT0771112.1 SseB family protein [Kineosporia corallincola]
MSHAINPHHDTDSAGTPWSGRTLTAQPFPGDDGTADEALTAALATGDLTAITRAWAPTRVLVPIVAVLGDDEAELVATQGDKSADMALVTLLGEDDARVLPVFTSVAALQTWNPQARPVPVEAARAAQAAVVEECPRIVIDPAGASVELPRPAVWAVAQGREWVPPASDPDLLAGIAALVTAVPQVRAHRCEPDGDAGLVVVLGLPPGLEREQVRETTSRIGELLLTDQVVTERTDSVRLAVRSV